jgi:hypothetical protein
MVNAPDWIRVRVQIVDGPKRIRERTGRDCEDVERVVGSRSSTRPYPSAFRGMGEDCWRAGKEPDHGRLVAPRKVFF